MKIFVSVLVFVSFFSFFIHPVTASSLKEQSYEACMTSWEKVFLGEGKPSYKEDHRNRADMVNERIEIGLKEAFTGIQDLPHYSMSYDNEWLLVKSILSDIDYKKLDQETYEQSGINMRDSELLPQSKFFSHKFYTFLEAKNLRLREVTEKIIENAKISDHESGIAYDDYYIVNAGTLNKILAEHSIYTESVMPDNKGIIGAIERMMYKQEHLPDRMKASSLCATPMRNGLISSLLVRQITDSYLRAVDRK